MRDKRRLTRRLIFAAAAVLLALALLEAGLRAAGFRYEGFYDCPSWWTRCSQNFIFEGDPELFWKLRPLANSDLDPARRDTQAINAAGLRDDDTPVEKAPGELRILSMGDSCTFGDGVGGAEAYANVLESLIRKAWPDRAVSVINAGVPGYTTYQIEKYLTSKLLAYKPDVLTVYAGFNDSIPAAGSIADKDFAVSSRRVNEIRGTLNRFRLYQLLNKFVSAARRGRALQDPTPFPSTGEEWPMRVSAEDFKRNLCDFGKLDRENGFRMIVMTLPHSFSKEPDFNGLVRSAAQECKIELLDLWRIMKQKQSENLGLYNPDGGHPNPLGHRVIAGALFEKLQEMGILKPGKIPEFPPLAADAPESGETPAAQKNVSY